MSELRKWDTMPDVDGYYWYRYAESNKADIGYVEYAEKGYMLLHDDDRWLTGNQCNGTWYGPLTPPWEEE